MRKIDEVIKTAKHMIDVDKDRDKAFQAYADQYHLRWELPAELRKLLWIRKSVVTDPHDSLEAGRRLLARGKVHITFQPYVPDVPNKRQANMIEQNLKWQLEQADSRKRVKTISDMSKSALLYDAVAVQLIDLDWQMALARSLKRNDPRMKAAREAGRFVVNVYNPMNVHASTSSYGVDAVLLRCERPARDVAMEWGWPDKLKTYEDKNLLYYDYIDFDVRAVWCTGKGAEAGDEVVLLNPGGADGKHGLPFIPWVALMGGSDIEAAAQDKYHPMLYASHFSGSWETMNAVRTIATSLGIARGGAPTIVESGPNPDEAEVDYMEPNRPIKAAPGNVVQPFPQPPLDPGLRELEQLYGTELQRSTIGDVLRGGQLPSGVSFSALNLATQTAASQLGPAKDMTENALAETFKLMLRWVAHSGKALMAYESDRRKKNYGASYTIEPENIDTSGLYLTVKIDPDVPTDKMAKANTAIMLVQNKLYPAEYAMEDLGIDDPNEAKDLIRLERYLEHIENMRMQLEMNQAMGEQQMAMAMQNQQAAQQGQEQAMVGPIPGGPGFNPAQGGLPPVQATAPENVNPFEAEAMSEGIPMGMEEL